MKLVTLLILTVVFFGSCAKEEEERYYTPEEAKHYTDSALQAKLKTLKKQNAVDIEYRKKIELRSRMDSIENAKKAK